MVVTQLRSHGETPENCLWSSGCLVSGGSGWDRDWCYKQEPDLQEASIFDEMTNGVEKKRYWDYKRSYCLNLRFKRWCGIMRSVMGVGIWCRAWHVQTHVENIYRLNRPWSSSSGRFAGIPGHVITSAYDGCAVKMRMIKCMCVGIGGSCVCTWLHSIW